MTEISRLLDAGSDINARGQSERTPLHHAVQAKDAALVRLLLSRGADASLRYCPEDWDDQDGDDAVICAAGVNAIAAMQELIAYRVQIHSRALYYAPACGHMGMVRLLLENTTTGKFSDIGRGQAIENVLPYAVCAWSLDMVRYLMENLGDDDNAKINTDRQRVLDNTVLSMFDWENLQDNFMEPDPGRDWKSALQIVKLLVDAGAQVNAFKIDMALTPLHFALLQWELLIEFIQFLVASGANVNMPDWRGRTQFFHLLAHPNATNELIESFKSVGGMIDSTDSDGNTPLHAVQNPAVAHWLLVSGANLTARNNRGETPLHTASIYGRLQIVSILLATGADVSQRSDSGWTPFMCSSSVEVSQILLQHGADVNAATEMGWTTLHVVSDCCYHDLAVFLLMNEGDVHALATWEREVLNPDLSRPRF